VKRDLKFEAVYPNRLEEVWHALTDCNSLADWLMENDFKPLPGHKFHFRSKSRFGIEQLIPCEVLLWMNRDFCHGTGAMKEAS
jgi:uncharacterized protein YndB with AHSA1/START domain